MNRNRIVLLNLLLISTVFVAGLATSERGVGTNLFFPLIHKSAPVFVTACKVEDSDGDLSTSGDQSALPDWTIYLIVNGGRQEPGHKTGGDGCTAWEYFGSANNIGVEEELNNGWTSLNGTSHDFGQAIPGSSHKHSFINAKIPEAMVEFRGLWVTRFDWTNYGQPASKGKIDQIVADAALAGFNAIFFQVRGTADAYYKPGPEPWAQRVSGVALGDPPPDPNFDPLAYFIEKAHGRGIQLHAYLNVYPVWDNCSTPPPHTSPEHFFYRLEQEHGTTGGKLNGLQWADNGSEHCSTYRRATPASGPADNHYLQVAGYLVDNYDIDGLHLDHIRYGGISTSCDPISQAVSGVPCFSSPPQGSASYQDWQRAQVNGTVSKFYNQVIVPRGAGLWLSAAVWPIYSTGYNTYYQDSIAWMLGGYIDSISPMIYTPFAGTPGEWKAITAGFQSQSGGRHVVPGIDADDSFDQIAGRIDAARSLGTAGHAIFSYGAMSSNQYFDDLAAGPYSQPAVVPQIPWHN